MKGWLFVLVCCLALQWSSCPIWAYYYYRPPRVIVTDPQYGSRSEVERYLVEWKRQYRSALYSDHKDIFITCDCAKGLKAYQMTSCEANERDAAQRKTPEVLQRCTREKMDAFMSYLSKRGECGGCLPGTVQVQEAYGTKRRPFRTVEQLDQEERQHRQIQEQRRELRREEERRRMADPQWQRQQEEKRAKEQADKELRKARKEEQARKRKDGTYDRERKLLREQQRQAAEEDRRRRMEQGWRPKERPNKKPYQAIDEQKYQR